MRCRSKKVKLHRWFGGAGVPPAVLKRAERKIAGETLAPQKARSLKEGMNAKVWNFRS